MLDAQREKQWNTDIRLLWHDNFFAWTFGRVIPRFVRPNHLTALRMTLTPIVLMLLNAESYSIGVPLFLFAAVTDAFDGSLARTRRQITTWGVIYDPIADKILIGSVLFLIVLQHVNRALGLSLLGVETAIVVGGLYLRSRGQIRPANVWGKVKMVAEVLGILVLLIALWFKVNLLISLSVQILAVALIVAIVSILTRL